MGFERRLYSNELPITLAMANVLQTSPTLAILSPEFGP
jgi:hypothetical protein